MTADRPVHPPHRKSQTPVGGLSLFPNPAGSVSEPKPLGKSTRRSPGVLCRALRLELLQLGIRPSAYTNSYPYPAASTFRRSLSLVYRDRLAISYRDHAHTARRFMQMQCSAVAQGTVHSLQLVGIHEG